jgi:hypothetical protein
MRSPAPQSPAETHARNLERKEFVALRAKPAHPRQSDQFLDQRLEGADHRQQPDFQQTDGKALAQMWRSRCDDSRGVAQRSFAKTGPSGFLDGGRQHDVVRAVTRVGSSLGGDPGLQCLRQGGFHAGLVKGKVKKGLGPFGKVHQLKQF